ncbi:hypothetical protein NUBL21997_29130 [Klebsiella pneumoniae]|nr:hypothetical protein NUBL21997_29130 [Klebsiella pneumoniae]
MLHFLIYDVLGTPAILVGLFSLIGLLLQKKGISDVISGTLKTIMGFVILTAGAGIIAYTLTIFSQLFLGAMMVISPAILQPFTRKITNTDDLALGHFGSIGYLLSALVGKIIGKGSPSIEEIKVRLC